MVIDGALDESAWGGAESGGGFYQTDPRNGYPATEDTQFKILYDEDNRSSRLRSPGLMLPSRPGMFLQSFVQYNTAAKTLATNIRYRFIHHPLSDFFIVYNESRGIKGNSATYRVVSVKLTHNLNF